MTITPSGYRRGILRTLARALACWAAVSTASAEDAAPTVRRTAFRGQAPSVPCESGCEPFTHQAAPWIVDSFESGFPGQTYGGDLPGARSCSDPFGDGASQCDDALTGRALMEADAVWQPYVALQGKAGSEAVGGFSQLMAPLYQDGRSLIFADLRSRFDDHGSYEGNFGLAVRTVMDPDWFVGMYAFYDYKRTEYGNSFHQGTIGVEAMTVQDEVRINAYFPQSGAQPVNDLNAVEFSNNTIFIRQGQERAYSGVDGEVGALLAEDYGGDLEFRGFLGGYVFGAGGGFPTIAGPKGRFEVRMYDLWWAGPESRLTVGVEMQHDSVRDVQIAGLARLEIPLGVCRTERRLTRLERRMLDRIVRDDDIITLARLGEQEVAVDPVTNRPLTNVNLVTARSNLRDDVSAAGPNSTVIVDGKYGPIRVSDSIVLSENQVLRGGEFPIVGSQTGAPATFGTRATIINSNESVDTILLANNSTVANLSIVGGRYGVASPTDPTTLGLTDLTGVQVTGNDVTRAAAAGFAFAGLDDTSTVSGNTAQSNGRDADGTAVTVADGFLFANPAGVSEMHATVQGNLAELNTGNGFLLDHIGADGKVLENRALNNSLAGIVVDGLMAGAFTDNTASSNGRNPAGAVIDSEVFAPGFSFNDTISGTIRGNIAELNNDVGFFFAGVDANGKILNNQALHNDLGGVFVFGTMAGEFSDNTATGNGRDAEGTILDPMLIVHGFQFFDDVSGTVSGNLAQQNMDVGFVLQALSGTMSNNQALNNDFGGMAISGPMDGAFTDNTASNNGRDTDGAIIDPAVEPAIGFDFQDTVTGTVSGNTAEGNTGVGFQFADIAAGSTVTTNRALQNDFGGVFVGGAMDGTFTLNTATDNGREADGTLIDPTVDAFGFDFYGPVAGAVNRNLAARNGGYGYRFDETLSGAVSQNLSMNNSAGGFFVSVIGAAGSVTGNVATFNGFYGVTVQNPTAENPTANGFSLQQNLGLFDGNLATGNSNNGFAQDDDAGNVDEQFVNDGGFSNNRALLNLDNGYRGDTSSGTTENNIGAGNINGGNTFP